MLRPAFKTLTNESLLLDSNELARSNLPALYLVVCSTFAGLNAGERELHRACEGTATPHVERPEAAYA